MYTFVNRVAMKSVKLAGLALVLAASASVAHAQSASTVGSSGGSVPEVDPGTIASGLTLLCGGILMLTDTIRRK